MTWRRRRWTGCVALSALALASSCGIGPRDVDGDETGDATTTVATSSTTTIVEARQFYTVRRGDTLVRIATRFDIDLNALVRENGIADPTRIYVGQQLLIPPPPEDDERPLLTIAPPTNPDLPPLTTPITFPTTTNDVFGQ